MNNHKAIVSTTTYNSQCKKKYMHQRSHILNNNIISQTLLLVALIHIYCNHVAIKTTTTTIIIDNIVFSKSPILFYTLPSTQLLWVEC